MTNVHPATDTVAAFDFDGTLTRGDTLVGFLRSAVGAASTARGLAAAQWAWRRRNEQGRDRGKRALLRSTLRDVPRDRLAWAGLLFADRLLRTRMRPDVVKRLTAHRDAGHQVVIVSAGLDAYLDPLAHRLGITDVICCRLARDESGNCTGELVGENVRGDVKATQLRALLGSHAPHVYAYGNDPVGDRQLLDMADERFLVGKRPLDELPMTEAPVLRMPVRS